MGGTTMKILRSAPMRLLAACLMMTAISAYAQKTETINYGLTAVKLSDTFTSALQSLNITAGTVEPTRIRDGVAGFPVVGGAIDLDTAEANVLHSGGLTLSAGDTKVLLESFVIDTTGSSPVLTGLVVVNGKLVGRLTLFNLVLPSGLTLPLSADHGVLQLKGVGVNLSSSAAAALNKVFSVKAFADGLDIGTADVFALLSVRPW
jgi:hypothetical protein